MASTKPDIARSAKWFQENIRWIDDPGIMSEAEPSYDPQSGEKWIPPVIIGDDGEVVHTFYESDWAKQVQYLDEQRDIVLDQTLEIIGWIFAEGLDIKVFYDILDKYFSPDVEMYADITKTDFILSEESLEETPVQTAYENYSRAVECASYIVSNVLRDDMDRWFSYSKTWEYKHCGVTF
jgi:hypothetical protein